MIEFAANNFKSESTQLIPFFATNDLYPYMSYNKVESLHANTYERILN